MVYLIEVRETPTYTRYEHIPADSKAEAYETAKRKLPEAYSIKVLTDDNEISRKPMGSIGGAMIRKIIAAYENNH